jgi:phage terminase large subunit-like protein
MQRITPTDRLIETVRRRLAARASTLRQSQPAGRAGGLQRAGAVARTGGISGRALTRAVVEGVLVDEFGEALVNEPRFQQVVERVTDALSGDADAESITERALDKLRTAGL